MKFSIIVPIYNVEKYLEECINSLLKQKNNNYEIILVDDGSFDNSPKICDDYAQNYANIKVIHKENGGLSDARNTGINLAKGDYLIFIDSDDYICDENFLNDVSNLIDKDDCDVIVYGNKKIFEDNKVIEKNFYRKIDNEDIVTSLIAQNYFKACAWDKIVKRELIIQNNLYFPIGRYSEDIEWCARLLSVIDFKKINVLNKNVYMYRQRENSITKNIKKKNITDMMDMIKREFIEEKNDKSMIINSFLAYEYSVVLGLINVAQIPDLDNEIKKEIFEFRKILNYDISEKVKKVKLLVKILGINNAGKILGMYIKLK